MKSPFRFAPYGECGKMVSDAVAPLGDCVDDMAFIPQHGRQDGRPFPSDISSGHRFPASGIPRHGVVDQLRTGVHQRKPADVRGVTRPSGIRQQRSQELGIGLFAGECARAAAIFPQRSNPIEDLLYPARSSSHRPEIETADNCWRDSIAATNRHVRTTRVWEARLKIVRVGRKDAIERSRSTRSLR